MIECISINKPLSGFRDVPDIPANNTLIIDQYTSDATDSPELFVDARSMKNVFEHFKPSVDVEFIGENGETILETLHFNEIQDFEVNDGNGNLITNSNFLFSVKKRIDASDSSNATVIEHATDCKEQEEKYKHLFSENITIALKATKQLETAYRTLDSFFQNTGSNRLDNLNIINVNRQVLNNEPQKFAEHVNLILGEKYNRLDLSKVYALLVIPGHIMIDKPTLLYWAGIAHNNKVLLITDHKQENSVDSLIKNIADYKGDSIELSHVVMTANWIEGRPSEKLSSSERDEKAFFIPPSAALAGKIYGQTNLSQSSAGQMYGILHKVNTVENNLYFVEVEGIRNCHIVPIGEVAGKVNALGYHTLYNGEDKPFSDYAIVRTIDWVEKVLQNYYKYINCENWDPYNSPHQVREKLSSFFCKQTSYLQSIQNVSVKYPTYDNNTRQLTIDVDLFLLGHEKTIRISVCVPR